VLLLKFPHKILFLIIYLLLYIYFASIFSMDSNPEKVLEWTMFTHG